MWKRLSPTLFLILLLAPAGLAQFTQMQIPQPTGLVNDFAGKLSPATKESLENLLTNFKNRSGGIEITVVTIPFEQMNDYPIEDYALELGRQWGVGSGSDKAGLVLLVAIKPPATDGRYSGSTRLEVSRHLEGDLPDGLAGELIRRMRVDFQNGRFDQALTTGAQTILATLAEKRGISMEGIDSSAAYHPVQRRPAARRGISPGLVIIILIVVFLLFNAIRRGGGGGRGGHRRRNSDWWVGPVIWGGGGGGWGGNSSGGWGGGGDSGGGWGGFGGGGDFGGGGASDSW